jgi:hypothetical protein
VSTEWEQYRDRYSERPETYDAYVDVWTRVGEARRQFSGWALFSQCANAEPAKLRDMPARVAQAERLMGAGGYEIGSSTRRGARRWSRHSTVSRR